MMRKKIKRIFCKRKNKENILKRLWSKFKQEKPKAKMNEAAKKLSKESNRQKSVELIFANSDAQKSKENNVTEEKTFNIKKFDVLTSENTSNHHCNERNIEPQTPEDSLADRMLTKITDRLIKIQADDTLRKEMKNVVKNILINRFVQDKTYNLAIKQENKDNNIETNSKDKINQTIKSPHQSKNASENVHDILQNKNIIKNSHDNSQNIFKSEERSTCRNGYFRSSEEQIEEDENDTVREMSFLVSIKNSTIVIEVGQKNSVKNESEIEEVEEEELSVEMEEEFEETEAESEEIEAESEEIEVESEEIEVESEEIEAESEEIKAEFGEMEAESQISESELKSSESEESERAEYEGIAEDIGYDLENEFEDEEHIIEEEDYLETSDDFKNEFVDEEKAFSKSSKRQQKSDFKDRRIKRAEIQRKENINTSSIIPFITGEKLLALPNLALSEKEKEEEERKQIEATTAMTNAYRLLPAIYRTGIQFENDIEDVEFEKVVLEKSLESPESSETASVIINEKDIFKYPSTPAILRMGSSTERSESDFSEDLERTKTKARKRIKSSTKESNSLPHSEESIEDSIHAVIWNLPKLEWTPTLLHIVSPNIIFPKLVYFVQEYFLNIDDLSGQIIMFPSDLEKSKTATVKYPNYVYDTIETPSEIELAEETKEISHSSMDSRQTPMTIHSSRSFHTPIKVKTECPKPPLEVKNKYYDRNFLIPNELSISRTAISKTHLNDFGKHTKQMKDIGNKQVKEKFKKTSDLMNEIVCKDRNQRNSKERKFAKHQIHSSVSSKYIPCKRICGSEESVIRTYQGKDDDEIIFGKIYNFEESSESLSGSVDSEVFFKTFKKNIRTRRESSSDHSDSEISIYNGQKILQYRSDILIRNNKVATEFEQESVENYFRYHKDSEMYIAKNVNTCNDFKQKCQKKEDIEYMRRKQTKYPNFNENWQPYMIPKSQHSIFYVNNEIIDILDDTLLVSFNENYQSDRSEQEK